MLYIHGNYWSIFFDVSRPRPMLKKIDKKVKQNIDDDDDNDRSDRRLKAIQKKLKNILRFIKHMYFGFFWFISQEEYNKYLFAPTILSIFVCLY